VRDQRYGHPDDAVEVCRRPLKFRLAGEGKKIRHDLAHPRRLRNNLREVIPKFRDPLRRDPVIFEDTLHQHGKIEHPRQRVVDLVCNAGGELPERSETIRLQQLPVSYLQLLRSFLHFGLQPLRELIQLVHGLHQANAHHVEGKRQFPQLFAGIDLNGPIQLHGTDRAGAFHELADGLAYKIAGEEIDEQGNQRDLDPCHDERPDLDLPDLPVHRAQI
jgi:hypothetical protein